MLINTMKLQENNFTPICSTFCFLVDSFVQNCSIAELATEHMHGGSGA